MPPLSGSYEADQQLRKVGQGAVISGKSTVVPLPKAHEDKRGELADCRACSVADKPAFLDMPGY